MNNEVVPLPCFRRFCFRSTTLLKLPLFVTGAVMSNTSSESVGQASGSAAGGQREGQNETLTAEELRKRRQAYFDRYVQLHV